MPRPRLRRVRPVLSGAVSRFAGKAIVWLRWPLIVGWIAAAGAAYLYLPGTSHLPTAGIYALVPTHTAAFHAITRSRKLFGTPLLPQIAVVQRNPRHLSAGDQIHIVRTAVKADEGKLDGFPQGTIAVPLVNTLQWVVPAARESSTTAITYLSFPGGVAPGGKLSAGKQATLADAYARSVSVPGATARATGLVPGAIAEANAISGVLHWVEIAAIAMVALIAGLYFRSVLAPLVIIVSAAILAEVSGRGVTWVANHLHIALHREDEPIVVVLLLGVITDYTVFFLSGFRDRWRSGEERLQAMRDATAQFLPIIFTAGIVVAASLASLSAASIGFVRALGPGMALVVLATLAVALTFVPAVISVFGRLLLWPGIRTAERDAVGPAPSRGARLRRRVAGTLSRPRFAVPALTLVTAVLCALGSGLFSTRVGMTVLRGLPASHGVHRAANEAAKGFAPGIVAPLEVDLVGKGVAGKHTSLLRLGAEIDRVPGVAAVIGAGVPGIPKRYDVFVAKSGDAARYLVVFDHVPFSASAVDDLMRLERRMPHLLASAGLSGAKPSYAGDTPIARDAFTLIYHDLAVVAGTIFGIDFVLLCVFLRALVAPLYLVAASALSIAATFGLATYLFQDLLGYQALTYYVPLAAGVLLLAFGSDYNIFVVGRIWQEAGTRPTREAIVEAVPRASRAISVAGVVLALSFATLAIVPLRSFREVAFVVGFGVLLDTFVVRTLMIPSLVALAGRWSWWPGPRSAQRSTSTAQGGSGSRGASGSESAS